MKRCTRAERIARHEQHNRDAALKQARIKEEQAKKKDWKEQSMEEILESIKNKRQKNPNTSNQE